jgi:hypothetical protein
VAWAAASVSDAVRLVALNGAFCLVGMGAVLIAGAPLGRRWVPTLVGLSPAAGLAVCGLAASLGAIVGVDVRVLSTGVIAASCLALAWLALRGRRPGTGSLCPPRPGVTSRVIEIVALAGLAVLSVSIVRLYAVTGLEEWDGWAIWAPKAHALFVEGDVWGPVFSGHAYAMQHQEYPIVLPALEALSADAIGRFDPSLIDIEPAAVLIAFGWGAWAVLRLVVTRGLAAAVALALTGSAPLMDNGSANYADSAVAAFTALGLVCLLVWLVRGSGFTLALAGLFLAASALTKAEGLVFALAAIVAALATARGFRRSHRLVLVFAAAVFLLPVVWAVVDHLNGAGARNIDRATLFRPDAVLDAAGRIPVTAWRLLDASVRDWALASTAILLALVAGCLVRLWWHVAFVSLWGGLVFVALVGVYYANTAPIQWLLDTSADRVVFSLVLGLAAMAPILVWAAWERLRSDGRAGPRDVPER